MTDLENIIPATPPVLKNATKSANLPVEQKPKPVAIPYGPATRTATLPAASVVYGVAASGLFVIALYFVLTGRWFTGALVLLPAVCFLGFALHFLRVR